MQCTISWGANVDIMSATVIYVGIIVQNWYYWYAGHLVKVFLCMAGLIFPSVLGLYVCLCVCYRHYGNTGYGITKGLHFSAFFMLLCGEANIIIQRTMQFGLS